MSGFTESDTGIYQQIQFAMNKLFYSTVIFLTILLFAIKTFAQIEKGVFLVQVYGKDSTLIRQGSGFFIDASGQGVTNDWIFKGASFARIITADSTIHNIRNMVRANASAGLVQFTVDNNLSNKFTPIKTTYTIPKSGEKVFIVKAEGPNQQ